MKVVKHRYLWPILALVVAFAAIVASSQFAPRSQIASQQYVYLPMVRTYGVVDGVGMTYSHCDWLQNVGAKWYYTWGPNPTLCPGLEAVPMIWGLSQAGQPVGGNSPWVMWFNECSVASQCNKTPAEAAASWNANINKYPGRWHVSPGEVDLLWLSQFLAQVTVRPQALAIHIYVWEPVDASISRTRNILTNAVDLARRYSIPEIWVTEWAGLPGWMGEADAEAYMGRVLTEVLPDYPMVTREAWFQLTYRGDEDWAFGIDSNTSLYGFYSSELTPFGVIYKDLTGTCYGDLNGDGVIDIFDIVGVGSRFGQTCP